MESKGKTSSSTNDGARTTLSRTKTTFQSRSYQRPYHVVSNKANLSEKKMTFSTNARACTSGRTTSSSFRFPFERERLGVVRARVLVPVVVPFTKTFFMHIFDSRSQWNQNILPYWRGCSLLGQQGPSSRSSQDLFLRLFFELFFFFPFVGPVDSSILVNLLGHKLSG